VVAALAGRAKVKALASARNWRDLNFIDDDLEERRERVQTRNFMIKVKLED
jgi:hypothetical protein